MYCIFEFQNDFQSVLRFLSWRLMSFSSHFLFFVLVDKCYEKQKYYKIDFFYWFSFSSYLTPCKQKTSYRKSRNLFSFLVTSSTNMKNGMKSSLIITKKAKIEQWIFLIILFDVSWKLPLCTIDLLSKRPCQNKTPCWLGSCVQQDDRGSLENMTTSYSTMGPRLF